MPKNSLVGPHYNRSIIILTPERALKFTAISQQRHYVWLTALSFLSHSPLSVEDLITVRPQQEERVTKSPPPMLTGSLRRRPIRDSIRVAKDSKRAGIVFPPSTESGTEPRRETAEYVPTRAGFDLSSTTAFPPTIRRFNARERSNTGPSVPQNSLRALMSKAVLPTFSRPSSSNITTIRPPTAVSTDPGPTPSLPGRSLGSSRRGSDVTAPGARPPYSSMGDASEDATMRMDAFIEDDNMPRAAHQRYFRSGFHKKDMSYWGLQAGRISISPVDSRLHAENRAATGSPMLETVEPSDPFRTY